MQRITNIIKPSILKRGKFQSTEYDETPVKQSQSEPFTTTRCGSFHLKKNDSSRSIALEDLRELIIVDSDESVSTFNSSLSSITSAPHDYDTPLLYGNETSFSSLKHIEDLKPRRSCAVKDKARSKDDKQVKVRKPRRLSLGKNVSPKPLAVTSTNVPETKLRRSRAPTRTTEEADEEVPRKIRSNSLCSKGVRRALRSSPKKESKANVTPKKSPGERSKSSRRITDYTDIKAAVTPLPFPVSTKKESKAVVFPEKSFVRSKSSRRITDYSDHKAAVTPLPFPVKQRSIADYKADVAPLPVAVKRRNRAPNAKAVVAPKTSTKPRSTSFDAFMEEYDEIMKTDYSATDYKNSKSVTGW